MKTKEQQNKQYYSILQWITEQNIVNEKGETFDFKDRPFLIDILTDFTPNIAVSACAQIGKSVSFSVKTLFAVKYLHFNIIYTFPTDSSVAEFVSSKFNKIIQANYGEFQGMEADSIERKELNNRFIFFKGTVSKTAPISTSADVLIHDEISRSDQGAIETYKSRTKASQYKGRWMFSNPGSERDELDLAMLKSDQKEWVITCQHCKDRHFLVFPDSLDLEKKCYICRECKKPISDNVRRNGEWVTQAPQNAYSNENPLGISGYHISHLMCCWISAAEIIADSEGDPAYFNNFVLGKAYSPGDLSVSKTTILDLWTPKDLTTGKVFLGVDVGNIKHYVIRSDKGILKIGRFTKDSELDDIIKLWKPNSGVIDAMPNTTLSRYIVETYPFMQMSYFMENSNNPQTIVWWGEGDKKGIVYSFRDRILDQFLVGMIEAKWLISVPADEMFRLYIKHFETLRRTKVTNNRGIERYVWDSTTGEDHFCFDGKTLITTIEGEKKIKDVKVGELVLTSKGYRKVLHSGITNSNAEIIEATFSNGIVIKSTANHPFYVLGHGMKSLCDLLSSDILLTCKQQLKAKPKSSFIREISLGDTQVRNDALNEFIIVLAETLNQKVLADCTKKYGKIKMEKYQKVLQSTISTIMHLITSCIIWNALLEENTNPTIYTSNGRTRSIEKDSWNELEKKLQKELKNLRNGLELKKGKSISTSIKLILLRELNLIVSNVVIPLSHEVSREASFVQQNALLDTMHENGEKSTQITILRKIKKIGKRHPVYNLHVEDVHEYYANGILVSNCFADLYSYIAMQGDGAGVFYNELDEKESILGVDNVWDISRAFRENNG